MSSILLHPEKGVNPFMSCCGCCGKDTNDLILVGKHEYYYECMSGCGQGMIGPPPRGVRGMECPKCQGSVRRGRKFHDNEKLPVGFCDECKAESAMHREEVRKGGVYWECSVCKQGGVIKHTAPFALFIRELMKIEAPKPCGIEFNGIKDDLKCPACQGLER